MVDRKILDERGVFVCDMDDLSDQLNEIHSTLRLLVDRVDGADDTDLLFGLQGAVRTLLRAMSDLNDIEEVLTESGAIVEADEYFRRKREAEQANVVPIKGARRAAVASKRARTAVAK